VETGVHCRISNRSVPFAGLFAVLFAGLELAFVGLLATFYINK